MIQQTTHVGKGTFGHPGELTDWLQHHAVDVASWGTGKAKSVTDLFAEIESKETTLQLLSGRVFRCLKVVKLAVRRPGDEGKDRHLVQVSSKSSDGRVKTEPVLPSGKLLDGESPVFACTRAVMEEMGTALGILTSEVCAACNSEWR